MSPERNRGVLVGAACALAGLVLLAQVRAFLAYTNDDAYITFRYSANLASGRGPYFNVGEHVEGYTNFLWMLLCAGLYRVAGHEAMPAIARYLELGLAAGALVVGARLAGALAGERRLSQEAALCVVAGGLVAVTPGYAVNAVSGLETGLYALLVTLGVAMAVREAESDSVGPGGPYAVPLALAGMTRPEGVLVGGLVWITLLGLSLRRPAASGWVRRAAVGALVLGGTFAAHTALRVSLYDGEWLPNTFYAKKGGFTSVDPLEYLWAGLRGPLLGLPGVVLALIGGGALVRARPTIAPAVLVALVGATLPLVTGADWMPGARMLMPYLPVIAAVAVSAWTRLVSALPGRLGVWGPLLLLAAVPVSGALQASEGARLAEEIGLRARGYQTGHEAVADWMLTRTEPGDWVSLMDVGIVGYRMLDRQVLDLSGLTDREIGHSPGPFLAKRYDPAYILEKKPRFIVLVYFTEGTAYTAPAPGSSWRAWTTTEADIFHDARFKEEYTQPLPSERTGTWVGGVAKGLGGAMAFEHGHPGVNYLLVVFQRQDPPAAAPSSM